ncbi:MAG TPA: phage portal protein [Allocoleopsis sp.]
MTKKDELISNANSLGFVIDYTNSSPTHYGVVIGRTPEFNSSTALKIIKNDPTVKAAIITLVDKTLESGWKLTGKDSRSFVKDANSKLEDLRFNTIIRQYLFNAFLYNNAFLEIVKKSRGEVTDLNVLETTLMEIISEDNGDVKGYKQTPVKGIKNPPYWDKDKICHFRVNPISTNVWAESDFQVLYETVLLKDYIRQWLAWFFGTNQMRPVFNFEQPITKDKAADFASWMKACEKDLKKPFMTQGKVTAQALYSFAEEGKTIQDVLNWCDEQILMLLQVPPIAVGKADSSGRSNSVEQYSALNTRIKSIQSALADLFTYDLLPKIGFEKVRFEFSSQDLQTTKQIFETVQIMKNSMFTDEAINEYLQSQGIIFNSKTLFKDPAEEAMKMAEASGKFMTNKDVGTGNEGMLGNKSADSAPSRQRQGSSFNEANKRPQIVKNSNPFNSSLSPSPSWVID